MMKGILVGAVALVALIPVTPAFAQNIMEVESITTAPGVSSSLTIFLTHVDPVQGFQTAVTFDNNILTLTSMDTAGLDVETLLLPDTVEFFLTTIDNAIAPGIGWGAVAAIFDSTLPFNGQTLPAGANQSIVRYNVEIVNDPLLVGTCTTVALTNGFGPPPGINNVITVNATSVAPTLIAGQICFIDLPVFSRGDANGDNIVNVADGIYTMQYLFNSGPQPVCFDATDFNDDEQVDISDFISLLNWQFTGGPPPASPYPGCGVDPTGPDLLGCLVFPQCGTFNPPPTITLLTPSTGGVAGGDSVTVTGTDFAFTSDVLFDGTPATSVLYIDSSTLQVITPAHAAGAVDVQVTNNGGAATLPGGFTYQ